jgi:hypothetical protein
LDKPILIHEILPYKSDNCQTGKLGNNKCQSLDLKDAQQRFEAEYIKITNNLIIYLRVEKKIIKFK